MRGRVEIRSNEISLLAVLIARVLAVDPRARRQRSGRDELHLRGIARIDQAERSSSGGTSECGPL